MGRAFSVVVALVCLAASASAADGPWSLERLQSSVDYIYPSPADVRSRVALHATGEVQADGVRVDYRAFNGVDHKLTRFDGKHVTLLMADSWLGLNGLTEEEREQFIDRLDINFELYRDLIGGEPGGDGLLSVATVKNCGWGCGYVGWKGIEIDPDQYTIDVIRNLTRRDELSYLLIHEMAHNFDIYNAYLYEGHAWTWFLQNFIPVVSRTGDEGGRPPAEAERYALASTLEVYLADPTSSWDGCMPTHAGCGIEANGIWAGVVNHFASLHGAKAVRAWLRDVRTYKFANQPPNTEQGRADLMLQTMSTAIGADVSCYADYWRWSLSTAKRNEMKLRFPQSNAVCVDGDGDGRSRLAGDCDDTSASMNIGAAETRNGVDDDCNGVKDDVLLAESEGGDFSGTPELTLPVRVRGRITVESVQGPRLNARMYRPAGVAADPNGTVYFVDNGSNAVRRIAPDGTVSVLAGSGAAGSVDGPPGTATFDFSWSYVSMAVDSAGNVYVPQGRHNTIRKVAPDGTVTTVAGLPGRVGSTDGPVATALFNRPHGVAVSADGTLFVADTDNHVIRKITTSGVVSTVAGAARQSGSVDGPAATARFLVPVGIAVAADGTLYVADRGNNTIRAISPSGQVSTLAGTAGTKGCINASGSAARFNSPAGVTLTPGGDLLVPEADSRVVRRVTPSGAVEVVAGTCGQSGSFDGPRATALLNWPVAVANLDATSFLVVDQDIHTIRKVSPESVETFAGKRSDSGRGDSDDFKFSLPSAGPVRFELASRSDFQGWLFLHKPVGGWESYFYVGRGNIGGMTRTLAAGNWRVSVDLNNSSLPGSYEALIRMSDPPRLPWATVSGSPGCETSYQLKAVADSRMPLPAAAARVRYWVSGIGYVASAQYSSSTTAKWFPQPGRRALRAGAFDGDGFLVDDLTPPLWFDVVALDGKQCDGKKRAVRH